MATSTNLEFDDTTIPARAPVTVLDSDDSEFILVDYHDEHYLVSKSDLEPLFGARIPPRRYVSAETVHILRPALDLAALPSRLDADGVTRYDILGEVAAPTPEKDETLSRDGQPITVISKDEVEVAGKRYFSTEHTARETGYTASYLQALSFANKVRIVYVSRKLVGKGRGRSFKFYDVDSVREYRAARIQYGADL